MKIELVERNTPCGLDHACVDCSQNKKERKENRTCDPSFTLDIFLMLSSSLYSCFLSSEVPASLIKIILFSLDYSIRVFSFRVFPAMAPALSYRRSLILINIKSLREEEWNISVYHS